MLKLLASMITGGGAKFVVKFAIFGGGGGVKWLDKQGGFEMIIGN